VEFKRAGFRVYKETDSGTGNLGRASPYVGYFVLLDDRKPIRKGLIHQN